jgi:hypothetical protein
MVNNNKPDVWLCPAFISILTLFSTIQVEQIHVPHITIKKIKCCVFINWIPILKRNSNQQRTNIEKGCLIYKYQIYIFNTI